MAQNRIYNYFDRNPQLHVIFIFDRMKHHPDGAGRGERVG